MQLAKQLSDRKALLTSLTLIEIHPHDELEQGVRHALLLPRRLVDGLGLLDHEVKEALLIERTRNLSGCRRVE